MCRGRKSNLQKASEVFAKQTNAYMSIKRLHKEGRLSKDDMEIATIRYMQQRNEMRFAEVDDKAKFALVAARAERRAEREKIRNNIPMWVDVKCKRPICRHKQVKQVKQVKKIVKQTKQTKQTKQNSRQTLEKGIMDFFTARYM